MFWEGLALNYLELHSLFQPSVSFIRSVPSPLTLLFLLLMHLLHIVANPANITRNSISSQLSEYRLRWSIQDTLMNQNCTFKFCMTGIDLRLLTMIKWVPGNTNRAWHKCLLFLGIESDTDDNCSDVSYFSEACLSASHLIFLCRPAFTPVN